MKSPGPPLRRRLVRRMLQGLFLFFGISTAQVLYVRQFPPLTTWTMQSRQWEAASQGRPSSLQWSWIPLTEVSPNLIRAVLAGEDALFYVHSGFDLTQIKNAWIHNQKTGTLRGASTLTQQTARNLFLWQHRSWVRKGLEAYYTVLLELFVPKDRILELYLNVAEWGDLVFGVEAASKRTFKKPAAKLSNLEGATLSASLPNPRKYPPDGDSRFVRNRTRLILDRMQKPAEGWPKSR